MAKRKGKSEHRRSDWHQQYQSGGRYKDRAPVRQRLTQRSVKLPAERLEAPEENLEDLPKIEGMIVGHFPGGVAVRLPDGEELLCGIAKTFRAPEGSTPLAVGDNVTVALTRPENATGDVEADKVRADGMVLARAPRDSGLARPQPRSAKRNDPYATESFDKIIVANMDVLLIVASTQSPPFRHGLVDRFLIIAERGELAPVLVVTKIDLTPPDPQVLSDIADLGVEIHLASGATGEGIEELAASLRDKRSVLAGASGVGKTTLVNALIPSASAATRTVRDKDQRGRHTTTASVVYDLPGGGILVDTPGVRELGVQLDAAELPWYFPEFEPFAPYCRFNDCTHTHEPDCAVQLAVENGAILPRRYESYLRLLDGLT